MQNNQREWLPKEEYEKQKKERMQNQKPHYKNNKNYNNKTQNQPKVVVVPDFKLNINATEFVPGKK